MTRVDDFSKALMSAAADAIIVIDGKGVMRNVSDSANRLFGYTSAEVVGRNVSMLMPEPDASRHDRYVAHYLSTSDAQIIGKGRDVKGRKKSGEVFPMHLSVGESHIDGQPMFVGICHDLSDYWSALERLAAAEKRYEDIVQSQKHYICRIDQQLRFTFVNASLSQALGIENVQLLGVSLDALSKEGASDIRATLLRLFEVHTGVDEISIKVAMKTAESTSLIDWTFRRLLDGPRASQELQGFGVDIS